MRFKLLILAVFLVLVCSPAARAGDGPSSSATASTSTSTPPAGTRPSPHRADADFGDWSLNDPFDSAAFNWTMAAVVTLPLAALAGCLVALLVVSYRNARKRAAPYVLAELRAVLPDSAMTPTVKRALHPPLHRFSAVWALGWAMYRARASAFKLSKAQAEHTFQRQVARRQALARVMAGEAAAAMAMEAKPPAKPYWVVVVLVAARNWPWTRGQTEALATARRRMGSPFLRDVLLTEVMVFPHYRIPELAAPKPPPKAAAKGKRLSKQAAVDVGEPDDEDDDPHDDKA